ncbi:MAG: hypothetical protein USCAAHI_00901 [Beijerinckiaceae bacterium]|nr:MAG: hypothetical protein USCAAHI_00901 [Beijerinckiaceae bacterium]
MSRISPQRLRALPGASAKTADGPKPAQDAQAARLARYALHRRRTLAAAKEPFESAYAHACPDNTGASGNPAGSLGIIMHKFCDLLYEVRDRRKVSRDFPGRF